MTPDPTGTIRDLLAACRNAIADLDAREAAHFADLSDQAGRLAGLVDTVSRALADGTAALARLDDLDRQVTALTRQPPAPGSHRDGSEPSPSQALPWQQLAPAQRQAPAAELRSWVDHVYRPGYGHLAVLGPCWPEHDLCLYGLDILRQLWTALYLTPGPGPASDPAADTGLLSARAEYQARILPAIAAQAAAETTRCGHPAITTPSRPGARP